MASLISSRSKYGPGHKIALKENPASKEILHELNKYQPESGFEISNSKKHDSVIQLKTGSEELTIKSQTGKIIHIIGSKSAIEQSFNHAGGANKSDTTLLTEIKEHISLMLFLNGEMSEDEVIAELTKLGKKYSDNFETKYLESGLKQLKELRSKFPTLNGTNYSGERQRDGLTAELYKLARSATGIHADNWNPADVWLIKKTFHPEFKQFCASSKNIVEINSWIQENMNKRNIFPISLKHVSAESAHFEEIGTDLKIDLNFSLQYIDLAVSFNNFIPQTACGFQPRAGFKSSSTSLSVFVEGRMRNAGYQLGAVDKKRLLEKINVKDGRDFKYTDAQFLQLIKKISDKVILKSGGIITSPEKYLIAYKELAEINKKRASNLILVLDAFMNQQNQKEFYSWLYKMSRKITDTASPYFILH